MEIYRKCDEPDGASDDNQDVTLNDKPDEISE
mgnify:FL=1